MTLHPASLLRRTAQAVRHAPALRRWAPLWDQLRRPYRRALATLSAQSGMPVAIGGYTMRLSSDVVSLNWETVEVESYRVFANEIVPGDVVFDVGAHFGTYSMIAAWRSPDVRIVAYEPSPLTRQYLIRHLEWNGLTDRVLIREICCGRSSGEVAFFIHPDRPEGINGMLADEGLVEQRVACTTLDADAALLRLKPSFIKIDVEGAELDVLAGAEATLAQHAPRLLVSLHPRRLAQRGQSVEEAMQWLRAHRYRPEIVGEDQEIHVLARATAR